MTAVYSIWWLKNGCMPRESSLGEDWKNNSLRLHQPLWIEAPAEKEQQAIGQNYYFDRWDAALGQSFYPAEMKRCECEDCNCFKNRLGFKTVPEVSGSMERRSESLLRYTHQLTVCSPTDISLWRARQWEEYERHFAWLVLGKKG